MRGVTGGGQEGESGGGQEGGSGGGPEGGPEGVVSSRGAPGTAEDKLKQPGMDAERQKALEFGSNLRWKVISSHWVQLIAQGCSEGEVQKLLAYVPMDRRDRGKKSAQRNYKNEHVCRGTFPRFVFLWNFQVSIETIII